MALNEYNPPFTAEPISFSVDCRHANFASMGACLCSRCIPCRGARMLQRIFRRARLREQRRGALRILLEQHRGLVQLDSGLVVAPEAGVDLPERDAGIDTIAHVAGVTLLSQALLGFGQRH